MIPNRVRLPSETLKPANSIVASLGMGMQALSRTMSRNTPARPVASITLVAAFTSGPRMSPVMRQQHYTRPDVPPPRPLRRPGLQPSGAAFRGGCGARGARLRPGLQAALPRFVGRNPRSLLDDAPGVDRVRRPGQGHGLQRPRSAWQVVALFPAP